MTRARDLGDFIADGATGELVVDTTTLVVDSSNNRVGIGTASPSQALDVSGTGNFTGITAGTITIDDITINDSTISDGADLTFDLGGNLIVDVDTGELQLKDAGTAFGTIRKASLNLELINPQQDGDFVLKVNDGGSTISAFIVDASEAASISFNSDVSIPGKIGLGSGNNYGTSGQVLTSAGSGSAATWADAAEANFTATATAAENLTANRYVALNSSGQFENMFARESGDTFYSPNYPSNNDNRRLYADYFGGDNFYFAALYDSTNGNHQVYVVERSTSGAGNTATKGAILSIDTGSNQPQWNMGIYRSSNSSFYYFWGVDQSSTVNYHVFTRSGTTITQSGSGTFSTDNQMRCTYPGFKTPWVSYNANQDKIVFSYITAQNYGYAKVLTPGSTSITANNSDQLIFGGSTTYHITHVENAAVGNCVVFVRVAYDSPYHTHVQAASISGTGSSASLTFGTAVDISNDNGVQESPVPPRIFDISQDGNTNFTNAMLILSEYNSTNLNRFAISVSGTTITDGNVVNNLYLGNDALNTWNAVHQKGLKRIYYGYVDSNNFKVQPLDTTSATFGNVSGSSTVTLQGTISGSSATSIVAMGASPSASNPYILTSAVRYTGSYYVRHRLATMVENNSVDWYGYLSSSVNSGQSATVILVGNVSNITCSLGSRLYLHTDGTVTSSTSGAYATVGLGTGTNTGTIYGKYVGVAGT